MEHTDKEYGLEVWGDWACFTRPEMKTEGAKGGACQLRCDYSICRTGYF